MSQDTTNEGGNLAALKRAAELLLTAIEGMRDDKPPPDAEYPSAWYGPFGTFQEGMVPLVYTQSMSVEWPDLNMLALQLREALKEVCDHHGALFDHPSGTGRCQCGATYHIATGWSKP